jgi:hypothetical protein
VLIFLNGKIVFTGAKNLEDFDVAYKLIVPALLGKYTLFIMLKLLLTGLWDYGIPHVRIPYTIASIIALGF